MAGTKPTPDAELEAVRQKVVELEAECENLRAANEELRQGKGLMTERKQAEELLASTIDFSPQRTQRTQRVTEKEYFAFGPP